MRMDVGDAYAVTPFRDSGVAIERFRFRKRIYWNEHVKKLESHISVLIAINLSRFRENTDSLFCS
jgi:hypothetical protein